MSSAPKSSLTVGVLLLGNEDVQYLEVAPVDLLAMMQPQYIHALGASALAEKGVNMDIHYISETGEGLFPLTANAKVAVTDSIETSPALDVLMIPGPPPNFVASEAVGAFIRAQVEHATAVLSVCTGIIPLAQSGVLKGKTATGPPPLILTALRHGFPDTKWEDERRWTRDGNVWTSAGITNGLDMMAGFMRTYYGDRPQLVELVLGAANVWDRPVEYREEEKRFGMGLGQ
ncbi:hypothetical protein W97_08088 [Coniosporium apollinis CBS 100218]|uniref:DJ-1/PfpI domain-containing protein n=1 Tax=Coniosporium apollinis (strain CBS 100218) TaxID=1168221 RepID=R7Z3Q4_CONA1|nr:uncharacterized protein W97_08088 [Coniosporium apollinis CBS 100218]EON68830.1 hypothetical protein W97_08088 [Coniosporium apollinis CBS 100218]